MPVASLHQQSTVFGRRASSIRNSFLLLEILRGIEAMYFLVADFFARKVKIIVLTLLTYAALC
jgi:hypothetical protein